MGSVSLQGGVFVFVKDTVGSSGMIPRVER